MRPMSRQSSFRKVAVLIGAWAVAASVAANQDIFTAARRRMVAEQLAGRDVSDKRVLNAMGEVPRHLFVPVELQSDAYDDIPLPIGHEQTISQPYIVALMTALARPSPRDRALEVGTGSGYQAAILSRLVSHVYTIEIVEPLARSAEQRLKGLGYTNITVRRGDGYAGWRELAPFDIVLVTAAPDHVPPPLLAQLGPGGRMVLPIGSAGAVQELQLIEKDKDGRTRTTSVTPVRFVPLVRPLGK
jgi:protein-L-isoaspartate(D-aspartate) O-methyltransferase